MCRNDRTHVWHTAVGDLDSVAVEDGAELVVAWEVLVYQPEEQSADVCFNGLIVRRIEPNCVSATARLVSLGRCHFAHARPPPPQQTFTDCWEVPPSHKIQAGKRHIVPLHQA